MKTLFEQISEATRPTDEKIEAMMNYPTFYFKKENTMGIYLLSVDKKSIKAPDAETAKIMAGDGWQLIVDSPYIPKELPKGTTLEQWERYAEDMERHEAHYRKSEPKKESFGFHSGMWPDEVSERKYDSAYSRWHMDYGCFEPNKPGYYRANND